MDESFENAPLVEIIAELHWTTPPLAAVDAAGNSAPLPLTDPNAVEAFFHRVSAQVAVHGFGGPERLIPQALVMFPQQMVFRYRSPEESSVVMQVGPGQFSVNALPPYKSWTQFRPWLVKGVEALLKARGDSTPLSASLRYIDAFRQDLTGGRAANAFMTEVLGFRLDLPPAIGHRHSADAGPVRAALQVALPVPGMQMALSVFDGQMGTDPAVLMDTTVQIAEQLPPDKDAIMAALDRARQLTHATFLDLTQSIRDRMQPVTAQGNADA